MKTISHKEPKLIIVGGPMFAGKTTWLLNYASQLAPDSFQLFKPNIDTRFDKNICFTHDGKSLPALNLDAKNPTFPTLGSNIKTILLDELNFYNESLIHEINKQKELGRTIVGAGLYYDHSKSPFGITLPLSKIADETITLYSVCDKCKGKAEHVYRKSKQTAHIVVGGNSLYGTCCLECWGSLNKDF